MRLIDADKLKEVFAEHEDRKGYLTGDWEVLIDNAPTIIWCSKNSDGLPLMDLRSRPQGEWVIQRLQNGFDDVYCPFCNARPTRSEYGYYLRDNFCHECGADMRKDGVE